MHEVYPQRYGLCEVCLEKGKVCTLSPDEPTYTVCPSCYITHALYRIYHSELVLAKTAYPSTDLWSAASLGGTSSPSLPC
jgi:hypothetical protein